jgi:hypothetical protein
MVPVPILVGGKSEKVCDSLTPALSRRARESVEKPE